MMTMVMKMMAPNDCLISKKNGAWRPQQSWHVGLWWRKRLMIMARNNGRMTRGGQEGDPVTIMGF